MKNLSDKLITIIIPVYNLSNYISVCIESVQKQTYGNIEILVINDGSTDNSEQIALQYAKKDSRIRVITIPNGGVSNARNTGINKARGDYICFVDGDDAITNDAIELMYNSAQDSDVATFRVKIVPSITSAPGLSIKTKESTVMTSTDTLSAYLYDKFILNSPCAKLYKRSTIGDIRFDTTIAYGEDMLFNYFVFLNAKTIACNQGQVYLYLQRPGSAMRKPFSAKRADSYLAAKIIRSDIKRSKNTALYAPAINKIFTEAVSIASHIPVNMATGHPVYNECLSVILSYRGNILSDRNTKLKNKLFSLITYLHPRLLIDLLRLKNLARKYVSWV